MNLDQPESRSKQVYNVARRRAIIQQILAGISGRSNQLLSFNDVQQQLHLPPPADAITVDEIPINMIVGSVGRYHDFDRAFLPRAHIDPDRWMRIERLHRQASLPPVDLFRVGEVYFVRDGHHRVSVARARGLKTIRARVVEIPVRVPLGPSTSPDDLILMSEYAEFLEKTALDRTRGEQHIELTRPGGYRQLLQHIEVHQFYMGLRSRHYPSLSEAAADWFSQVYLPTVVQIRDSGILGEFAGRTEADLYIWIAENQARLQMRYGGPAPAQAAIGDLALPSRLPPARRWLQRFTQRLFPARRPSKSGRPDLRR